MARHALTRRALERHIGSIESSESGVSHDDIDIGLDDPELGLATSIPHSDMQCAESAESMRAEAHLEWHRGIVHLYRQGLRAAVDMPDLGGSENCSPRDIEKAYSTAPRLMPWTPAKFAGYFYLRQFKLVHPLKPLPDDLNPISGLPHCSWKDRFVHLASFASQIPRLPHAIREQEEYEKACRKGDSTVKDPRRCLNPFLEWIGAIRRDEAEIRARQAGSPPPDLKEEGSQSTEGVVLAPMRENKTANKSAGARSMSRPAKPPEAVVNGAGNTRTAQEASSDLFNGSFISVAGSVSLPDNYGSHVEFNLDSDRKPIPPHEKPTYGRKADHYLTGDPRQAGGGKRISTIAPRHRLVESYSEIAAYLASASYVASLCGPPLLDMSYGIIIVPAGEEASLLGNWNAELMSARSIGDITEKSKAMKRQSKEKEKMLEKTKQQTRDEEMDVEDDGRLNNMRRRALAERRNSDLRRTDSRVRFEASGEQGHKADKVESIMRRSEDMFGQHDSYYNSDSGSDVSIAVGGGRRRAFDAAVVQEDSNPVSIYKNPGGRMSIFRTGPAPAGFRPTPAAEEDGSSSFVSIPRMNRNSTGARSEIVNLQRPRPESNEFHRRFSLSAATKATPAQRPANSTIFTAMHTGSDRGWGDGPQSDTPSGKARQPQGRRRRHILKQPAASVAPVTPLPAKPPPVRGLRAKLKLKF